MSLISGGALEGFLNFQPKDARGVEKTTGKVDINDSSSSSSSSGDGSQDENDRRAKTPTPHGRRKKMKKKKGQARNRSGSSSSSSSASSSDTAKEGSDDEKKGRKKKEGSDKEGSDREKKQEMARFFCAKPVSDKKYDSDKDNENNGSGKDDEKNGKKDHKEGLVNGDGGKKVSVSSSSSDADSDASFGRSKKAGKDKSKGSSDDYSDSKKEEVESRKTSAPKIVDLGEENDADGRDKEIMELQRPVTVMEVGASPGTLAEAEVMGKAEAEPPVGDKRKGSKHEEMYAEEQSTFYWKQQSEPSEKDDAASRSSSSSSPSPSSSSGSATIHDKGPNTANDPTLTLDESWRGQNGDQGVKDDQGQADGKDGEKEEKEKEEERKEKPKVEIIREDLNKKAETETGSSSDSSSSPDESDSDQEKKAGKATTTWQAQADVHQSESQAESDPEATHGGNDPDNVANGSSDMNGSRTFEPAVPAKANPGSVRPLLEASHTTLEIKGVTLNKSQVYEVAEFMEGRAGINSVNLVNCGIDDDDIQKLMEALRKSPSNPMMLNLGLNPLTVESVHHILTACKHKPTIEAVLLQGTRLGDDGVNALIAGMMAHLEDLKMKGQSTDKYIHELDLSDCKFGDQGALGIARLLTSAVDIDTLTLTHNHAISSDGWRAVGDALKLNSNLETLTLDHNFIGDQGIEHITQGLHGNTSVTAIDLNDVGVTNRGGKSILELLKRNTYILEITTMENKLSDEMQDNIQKYINLNKASFNPT